MMRLWMILRMAGASLQRGRATASKWLVIAGLLVIAYGVAYWWKGLPYPKAILIVCAALGCLPLGAGLYLRTPATTATLSLAAVSFSVSGLLQLVSFGLAPWQGMVGLILAILAWAGAADSVARLRRLRRNGRTSTRD
jgi:hypothetical protein